MKRILIITLTFLSFSISSCRFIVEPDMYLGTYTGYGTIEGDNCDTLSTTLTVVDGGNKKVDIHYSSTNGTQYNFYGLNVERYGSVSELIDISGPETGSFFTDYYCYVTRSVSGPSVYLSFRTSPNSRVNFSGDRY